MPGDGSPNEPLAVSSAGVGSHGTSAYLSIIAKDGRQFCFDVSDWRRAELLSDKLREYSRRARDGSGESGDR